MIKFAPFRRYAYTILLALAIASLVVAGLYSLAATDAAEHRACTRSANTTTYTMATAEWCASQEDNK